MLGFTYAFKEQMEYIYHGSNEVEQVLGKYICKVLSVDYTEMANNIASLLNEHTTKHLPYPEADISTMLLSIFEWYDWDELDKVSLELKNVYTGVQDKSRDLRDTVLRLYGSVEDYFCYTVWNYFNVIVVLQAYLDESMVTTDMLVPEKFEAFVSAAFNDHVKIVGCIIKGANLSDFDFDYELFPNSNIREMVKGVFSDLMQFDGVTIQPASLCDFVASSIFYFFRRGYKFKRCNNCGRFFVPFSRSDELYCDQPSPQDESRSCKQYGSERLWYDKLKQDEAAKLARNVYMAKQMLVKRNPDILGYKKMFEYFKSERKKWEALVKSGEKSKEEYINWLNEMKAKRTL